MFFICSCRSLSDCIFVMSESGWHGKSASVCFLPGAAMYGFSLFIIILFMVLCGQT